MQWFRRCWKKMNTKQNPVNLMFDRYYYANWFEKEGKSRDTTLKGDEKSAHISRLPLEGHVKEGKWLEILTTSKLLNKLLASFAQIKAVSNS